MTEEDLFQRLEALYSPNRMMELRRQWTKLPEKKRPKWEEPYPVRMRDLSQFMKESKQRFTQRYCQRTVKTSRGWSKVEG